MASAAPMLPPDPGPYRDQISMWDRLWQAIYRYDENTDAPYADTAPGYTRGWGRSIAGLFQRQPPVTTNEDATPTDLPDVLDEMVHKSSGYGQVLLRPVFSQDRWRTSVVKPTRFTVAWAERAPTQIVVWDTTVDPRQPDNHRAGLAIIETWTPDPGDQPGTVTTEVWTVETAPAMKAGWQCVTQLDPSNPPADLADHPYILSAQNDQYRRDMFVYVWEWDDIGPVPIWYTLEQTLCGLARLWDQEQDDAELARKRIAMPEDSIGTNVIYADDGTTILARPGFNKSDNLIGLSSNMSAQHGPTGGVTPIEFGDDLVQRERIEARENAVLEMVGINPQSIGRNVSGRSDSGTAKRADNQMTLNTISRPARNAAAVLTRTYRQLAALNRDPWGVDDQVIVREGLKENPEESATTARLLRDAEAASTATLVATAHPTWSDEQIAAEVEAMQMENRAGAPIE